MTSTAWLPLNEYALRSGTSISTLRRKIKNNSIEYRMEDGRYLIRGDDLVFNEPKTTPYVSSDAAPTNRPPIMQAVEIPLLSTATNGADNFEEVIRLKTSLDETALRMRALEARVNGLVKKLDFFSEQNAELKMLVKLFEEKLDKRA